MTLAEYNYVESIIKELQIEYPFSKTNLTVHEDVNISLALLFFEYKLKSSLYDHNNLDSAKKIYQKRLHFLIERALNYYKKNVDSDDDYNYLEKVFFDIKNQDNNAKTPVELFNQWPVMLAPNPFIFKNYTQVPLPFYVENIKDENYTRWGRDPFITIEFSLFTGCQINCSYCPHLSFHKSSRTHYMPFNTFKSILDKIPKEVGIVFAGFCDPLLYDDLERVIKYTYDQGYRINLSTTFPDKYPENIELFLTEKYWSGRCVHLRDEYMSYKNNSEMYYKNLDTFFYQVSRQYEKKDMKIDNRFSFLGNKIDVKVLELLKKNNLEHLFSVCKPHTRITAPIKYETPRQKTGLRGKIYCSVGFYRRPMISPDGDVVLDCMDVEKSHVLGNLLHCSYDDLFTGSEYKKILKGFNDENISLICRNCIYGKEIK